MVFAAVATIAVATHGAARKSKLPWDPTPSAAATYARSTAIAELGRELFFDPTLSASGRMSCATCHDPAHGFSASDASPVRTGGADLGQPGLRAIPSLMYGSFVPAFSEYFFESDDDGDGSVDQGPTGGRDWDGRADRARDQAMFPLFNKNEMANAGPAALAASVARSSYAIRLKTLYGRNVLSDPGATVAAVTEALEFFQETPAIFSPFTSKYDAYLRGSASLTTKESSGLAVFDDRNKGNCAQCHPSGISATGRPPLFTDFGYVALGVPRNPAIPANADPGYFDLGLCGPQRTDLANKVAYCGMFRAPTLRNVALKKSFYHNGFFHSLRDAVAFYATRDTDPGKWYAGRKFDDLPLAHVQNVSVEAPFGERRHLSDADVEDLVAFLGTLTDGYSDPK